MDKSFFKNIITEKKTGILASLIKAMLWVLSLLYRLGSFLRNSAFDGGTLPSHRLNVPVISVGNITVGGVGKTPLVMALAKYIQTLGKRPAVLMRGYMQDSSGSDEAELLRENLPGVPVGVGGNRFQSAQKILKNHDVDVFLMDDGFQHRQLQRDLDIVAINACAPFANGHVLPRGLLREPVSSLKRADLFVLTKTEDDCSSLCEKLKTLAGQKPVVLSRHQTMQVTNLNHDKVLDLTQLRGKKVCALSALGDPSSFEKTLTQVSLDVVKHFAFEDHYAYTQRDIEMIKQFCQSNQIDTIVTTAKDAVKLKHLSCEDSDLHFVVIDVELILLKGQDELFARISHLLAD